MSDTRSIFAEVASTGHCSHPIRLRGTKVDLATGVESSSYLLVACKDRRVVLCPSCSHLYKADAWMMTIAGLVGGKGVDEAVATHPQIFATFTAPSFGPVHTTNDLGACQRAPTKTRCPHGQKSWCNETHLIDDARLGTPLCSRCFDYPGAANWNATAPRLWERLVVRLRQAVASSEGLNDAQLRRIARINYLKVAEVQRRGLIHLHVVMRIDGPGGPASVPPEWLDEARLTRSLRRLVRTMTMDSSGGTVRWGQQFHIAPIEHVSGDRGRIAAYIAKYSTKSTDGSVLLARRFNSRREISNAPLTEHQRSLALAAFDRTNRVSGSRRPVNYAHTYGYSGQLITKSRGYSTTLKELRRVRSEYMANASSEPVSLGLEHQYDGRGYHDPRGVALAEVLHTESLDLQRERAKRSRTRSQESVDGSQVGEQS